MIEEPSAVETTSRPDPGGTLAVGAASSLLVLVTFTTPLTTLVSTAAGLGAGPGAQAWVLSAMPVGASGGCRSGCLHARSWSLGWWGAQRASSLWQASLPRVRFYACCPGW